MRYKSVFRIDKQPVNRVSESETYVERGKDEAAAKLGMLIGKEITFSKNDGDDFDEYELDVEVFSRQAWTDFIIDFKNQISEAATAGRNTYDMGVMLATLRRAQGAHKKIHSSA